MSVKTKELFTVEQALPLIQSFSLEDRVKLLRAVGEKLPPGALTQVIVHLLPPVAPTIEGFLLNKTSEIIGGGKPGDTHQMLLKWLDEPVDPTDDDESWDEIMRNVGAYDEPDAHV